MQVTLQPTYLSLRLLRPRILLLPPIIMLGDGHIAQRLLRRLHMGPGLDAHELTKALYLVQNHLLHLANLIDDLEVEVEGGWADGLVGRVVPDVQVAVLEGLLDRDALRGVEGEHFIEQVERVRVRVAEQGLEGDFLHVRQVADVLLSAGRANAREGLFVGRTKVMEDLVELIDVVAPFEERFTSQEFGEDAAHRPDIDCLRVT